MRRQTSAHCPQSNICHSTLRFFDINIWYCQILLTSLDDYLFLANRINNGIIWILYKNGKQTLLLNTSKETTYFLVIPR